MPIGAHRDGKVEYEDESSELYCPRVALEMAFVCLIAYWVVSFLSCLGFNWKTWNRACGKEDTHVHGMLDTDVAIVHSVSRQMEDQRPPRYTPQFAYQSA